MLDRIFSLVRVTRKLVLGKNASLAVTNADGSETTVSIAELAALDSIAAADLAKIDGITNGTGATGKALVLDSAGNVQMPSGGALLESRIVATTATVLALTVTQHSERVVVVNSNSTVANTLTLPVATGSGARFTVINNIAQTQGSVVVAANGTLDVFKGVAVVSNTSTTVNVQSFLTSASSDKVTWNRTTSGGAGPGDYFEAWDSAANVWTVQVRAGSVGAAATPFSES
jgi:hypothetical protein